MPQPKADFKTKATSPDSCGLKFFQQTILRWGHENFVPFPWRSTQNRFHALIAEMMLQRTRAEQVVPVFNEFAKRYPSPSSAARARTATIERMLSPLGLVWRSRNIRKSLLLLAQANDRIPFDLPTLRELPGVGEYAAAAYSIFHLKKTAPLIDANIVRLYGRYFGFETDAETRRKAWFRAFAKAVQPNRQLSNFGYALLDFTRSICTPRPRCDICPIRSHCSYAQQNRLHASPNVDR